MVALTAIACNKTGNLAVAEELVQETFINFYKHKLFIDENTSVKAYLYVILKNKITDYYRLEVMHQRYTEYITRHTFNDTFSSSAYIETRDLEKNLKEAIANLPPKCQEVFRLSREHYLTDKEIAAEMGISLKTVEQHKSKALRLLRGALDGLFELVVITYFLVK